MGTSKSNVNVKKAVQDKAVKGCAPISSFFKPVPINHEQIAVWESNEGKIKIIIDKFHSPSSLIHASLMTDNKGCSSLHVSSPPDPTAADILINDAAVRTQDVQQTEHNEDIQQPAVSPEPINLAEFLNITADKDKLQPPPLSEVVKTLMLEAKKHKSFQALFKLQAIKNYLELLKCYHHVPNIRDPVTWAGLTVAKSVGKGPYFARKVWSLVTYVKQFQCLPPNNAGKHHMHPSLLNNEQIYQAVCQYLAVQPVGEVSQSSTQFGRIKIIYLPSSCFL